MGILMNTYVFLRIYQWRGFYFFVSLKKNCLIFGPQQQCSCCSPGKVLIHSVSSQKAHVFKAPDSFYVSISPDYQKSFLCPISSQQFLKWHSSVIMSSLPLRHIHEHESITFMNTPNSNQENSQDNQQVGQTRRKRKERKEISKPKTNIQKRRPFFLPPDQFSFSETYSHTI